MKKLGQEYISEFNGDDIHVEKLAEELGVSEFRFPDEYYQHAEVVIQQLAEKIIPNLRGLELEQIGEYLVEHRGELFAIFDMFPEMHRLPLLVKRDVLVAHGLLTAQLMGMSATEFYNAFLNCMHFYLYLKSVKNLSDLYARYPHIQGMTPILSKLVDDECNNEVKCAWGMRSSYFFNRMVPGEKGADLVQTMLQKDAYIIPKELRAEYKRQKIMFWRRKGLGPERILLNISHLVEDRVSTEDQSVLTELDVPALNFFLCQNDILGYEEIISKIFRNPDHTETWVAWIKKYFDVLMSHDSQAKKVFYYVFGLDGNLFENGVVPNRLKRKKDKNKKGSTTSGLPDVISDVLEREYRFFREKKKIEKKEQKPSSVVARIQPPVTTQTAMSTLITRATQPEKIVITLPETNTVFPELAEAKKNKKQITHIDLSNCDFPQGTTISIQRSLPARKPVFETIKDINPTGINMIPVVMGNVFRGHFGYRIVINLPSTHRFAGNNTIEVSYYAEAEPTPEEIEEQKRLFEALKNQPKGPEKTAPVVVEQVEKKVERVIDPVGVSLTAVAMVLEAKKDVYSGQEYSGGPIIVTLTHYIVDVLGEDAKAVLDEHKQWTITEDGIITPAVSDTDVNALLMSIVGTIRTRYQTEQQQREAELQQQRELEEYEKARKEFEPILSFAKAFRFEGREKGDFEAQKSRLRDELDGFGWSMPVALTNNQVIWRHKSVYIKILYASKMCSSFIVEAETKGNITPATQKCYEEVGEAFAHIARFFNAETRERKKMVTREQAIRKETETGAIAYEKLLAEGRARLVLYNPYQGSYGAWSSKFPTEKKPYMLDERASHATVTSLLEQYPHAELCYRRDQLCINGEIADDAGEESVENTLQNIADLRQSPRARYILTKRILITLGLEKFGGDTSRAPIKHEKNKKEGRLSALDILLALKQEKGVQTSADITEQFLDAYIDALETNRIRVHYTWPLSVRLDEHQKMIQKSAAVLAKPKSTAD